MALRSSGLHDAAHGGRLTRADLRAALSHPNVAAFLRVIRNGESSQEESAYRLENGGRILPECPVEHPSKGLKSPPGRAFGAYQFLASTWAGLVRQYGFESMSPQCQDEAAIALCMERRAVEPIIAGDLDDAFRRLNSPTSMWTSLPGGSEPNRLTSAAYRTFTEWQRRLAPAAPVTDPDAWQRDEHYGEVVTESTINPVPSVDAQEAHMAPLIPVALAAIQAFGPQLLALIPQFGSLLGSGSDVQVRNVKLATAAVDAVVKATGSNNLQAAIETMQRDPEAAKAGQIAAAEVLALVEVGGGIVEARKASYDPGQVAWWMNPAVIVAIAVLPLVYMVVSAVVFGVGGQAWSDDVKTLTVTAILSGALGSITGFFLGSSLGSQRKTSMFGKE